MKIVTIHKSEIAPVSNTNGDATRVFHERPPQGYNTEDIHEIMNGCEKPEALCSPLEKKFLHARGANLLHSNESHKGKDNSCVFNNTGEGTPVGGHEYVNRPLHSTGGTLIGEGHAEKETSSTRGNNHPSWGKGTNGTPSTEYQRSEEAENDESLPDCHSNSSTNKNFIPNGGHSRLVKPPHEDFPNSGDKYMSDGEGGEDRNIYRPPSVDEWENLLEGNPEGHPIECDEITASSAPHGSGKNNLKRERITANGEKVAVVMRSDRCQQGEGLLYNESEEVDTHTGDKNEEETSPVRSLLVFDEITNTWNILWKFGNISIIKSYDINMNGAESRHVALDDLQSINNLYGQVTTDVDYVTPEEKWDFMKRKIYNTFGEKYFFIRKDGDGVNGQMSDRETEEWQSDKAGVGVESIGEAVSTMGQRLREAHNDGRPVKCEQICSVPYHTKGRNGNRFDVRRGSVISFDEAGEGPSVKCEEETTFSNGEWSGKRARSNGGGSLETGDTEDIPTEKLKAKEGMTLNSPPVEVPTPNVEGRRELLRKTHENKLKEQLERKERKLRREKEKEKKMQMRQEKKKMREEKKKIKEQERLKRKEENVILRKMKKLEKWENVQRLRRWKKMQKLEKMERLGMLGRREKLDRQEKLYRQEKLHRHEMLHRQENLHKAEGLAPMDRLAKLRRIDVIENAEKLHSVKPLIGEGKTTKGNACPSKLNSTPGKDEDSGPNRSSQLEETNCTLDSISSIVKMSPEDEEKKRLFMEKKQKVFKVIRKNAHLQGRVFLDVGYTHEECRHVHSQWGDGGGEEEQGGDNKYLQIANSTFERNAGSWVVSWVLYGRTRRKKFPIRDYGFEKARQMAEEYKKERINFILNNISEYDTYVRDVLSSDLEEGTTQDACTVMENEEEVHHKQLIQFCSDLLKKPISEEHWKNKVKWVQNKKSWIIEIIKKEQNKFIREKIYYSEEKYGYIIGKCIAVYDYLNAEHDLLKNYFDVNVANLQYDSKRHAWKISRYVPHQLNKKNYYFDVRVYGWMYSRKLGLLLAIYLNAKRPQGVGFENILNSSSPLVRHLQENFIHREEYLFRGNCSGEVHSEKVTANFCDDAMEGLDLPASSGHLDPCKEKRVKYSHANGIAEHTSKQCMRGYEVGASYDATCKGGSPTSSMASKPREEEKRDYSNAPCGLIDRGDRVQDNRDRPDEQVQRGRKRRKKMKGQEERSPYNATDDEETPNGRRHSQNDEKEIKNKTTTENEPDLKKFYETVHNKKYCQLKEMHTCSDKELLSFLSNEKDRALFLKEDIHIQGEDEEYLINILENYYYYNLCRKMLKVRKKLSM
ncbi:hypothetical protein AK88_03220 [Plasmodium fragile]|uniref:Uncharacterized protein n=1 Tax=Plasmodium fragile TaxID=5857 RepID=A0A0D9QJQ6_PLAFR|nr:uncharacterized protein AK88_03220 [Plasmodium fragile]KJP87173.1 hypothetical protein AK88_03220 [Plasmodium fragile]